MGVSSGFRFVADHGDDVDEVAIARRIDGDRTIELSQRELEVAVWELTQRGHSGTAVSKTLAYHPMTVLRIKRQLGLASSAVTGDEAEPVDDRAGGQ